MPWFSPLLSIGRHNVKFYVRLTLCCQATRSVGMQITALIVPGCSAACTPVTINNVFQTPSYLPFMLGMCRHLMVSFVPRFRV